ncbi:helix-turn-helix domain-containing protein [Sphaerisporangium sp. NPDC051011]|uniref:helix-turn-helix domain-containing protein n=1 Tax=Sphaerisporangium sp. NPDC051011 TaxID=3155792 RepID=UPI0033C39E79
MANDSTPPPRRPGRAPHRTARDQTRAPHRSAGRRSTESEDTGEPARLEKHGRPGEHGDAGVGVLEAVEREAAALFAQARRLVEALAARAGLEPEEFRCLCALSRQGPLRTRELAAAAGLSGDGAARAVDRLERRGCAARRGTPGRVLVHPDLPAYRARAEPALRELRETWQSRARLACDDLALVAGLLAEGRRLTDLVVSIGTRPDAFTM